MPVREYFHDGLDPIDPKLVLMRKSLLFMIVIFGYKRFIRIWNFLPLPKILDISPINIRTNKLMPPLCFQKENYFSFDKVPYRIFHLADETRPAMIISSGEILHGKFIFSRNLENKRIKLGISLNDRIRKNLLNYNCKVNTTLSHKGKLIEESFSFPINGSDGKINHRLGESWFDWYMEIPFKNPHKIELSLNAEFVKDGHVKKDRKNRSILWSAPQILSKNSKQKCHKIVFISIESFSDPLYLEKKLDFDLDIPFYQRLKEESCVYSRAYSQGDSTLPLAGAFLTGLLPSQHGITDYKIMPWEKNIMNLSPKIKTIAEILKENGFYNQATGAQPRFSPRYGWYRGFDSYKYRAYSSTLPSFYSRFAIKFLDETTDIDSFLFMFWDGLHDSFWSSEPQGHIALKNYKNENGSLFSIKSLYSERLHSIDIEIGILTDYLKSTGLWDETLFIITADHGWGGGKWEKKSDFSLYEERIRVPFVVKYPANMNTSETIIKNPINASISPLILISDILNIPLPQYYDSLPQRKKDLEEVAVSETVMQPDPDDYAMAINIKNYKYVFRCKIDWTDFCIKKFLYHKLYQVNDIGEVDESEDISRDKPKKVTRFKLMATNILQTNLTFQKNHSPINLQEIPC